MNSNKNTSSVLIELIIGTYKYCLKNSSKIKQVVGIVLFIPQVQGDLSRELLVDGQPNLFTGVSPGESANFEFYLNEGIDNHREHYYFLILLIFASAQGIFIKIKFQICSSTQLVTFKQIICVQLLQLTNAAEKFTTTTVSLCLWIEYNYTYTRSFYGQFVEDFV